MNQDIIIKKLQVQDSQALELLYTNYSDSLLGVIYNIVRDTELAEEILQDVFIKVWNNIDSYNNKKGRLYTWMLNIARNAAIDNVRSKAFNNSKKNLHADFFVDILEDYDDLDQSTNAIGLRKIVGKLAEKCYKIIDFIYFKGFTQKETAEALEIPIGTVKTRNRNCLGELRTMLDD